MSCTLEAQPKKPPHLYVLCVNQLVSHLDQIQPYWTDQNQGPFERLAGTVAQDILEAAYELSNKQWRRTWKVLLNQKLKSVILPWDENLLKCTTQKCQKLQQILIASGSNTVDISLIGKLAGSATCVDFDGELYFRGRYNYELRRIRGKLPVQHWLPEAETLLRALYIAQQKLPDYLTERSQNFSQQSIKSLSELHLGTVRVSATDICHILESLPNIRLLRHYQLVSALYMKHAGQWKAGQGSLPRYNLLNLDADFSHVVRCRMSPQSVLPIEALALAVTVCPQAESVRMRYDCSTHHDSMEALTSLPKLKELSVVCVTSGERCLLDFSDIVPILETHGGKHLKYLELKVIEEVDPHVIIQNCPKLRVLILSGCGYVFPDSCPQFQCARSKSGQFLSKLRLLFYADGDDFSWDHSLPQCFWYSTLSIGSHLRGLFLESPRIHDSTLNNILHGCSQKQLLPEIQILSLCRYSELSFQQLQALAGSRNLQYLRISQCDQFKESHMKRLRDLISDEARLTYDLEVEEAASGGIRVGRAAK